MNVGFRFLDGKLDWGWICNQNPILRVEDTSGIVAVDSDTGELLAACVMDNWSAKAVHCHIAVTNPVVIRHGFLQRIGQYIFKERGKQMIIGYVPASNRKAMKMNKHLGFIEKTRFEGMCADGSDYVIMELRAVNTPDLLCGKNRDRGI